MAYHLPLLLGVLLRPVLKLGVLPHRLDFLRRELDRVLGQYHHISQEGPGRSINDTAFVGKQGISWLVFGTRGDHSIRAEGKSQVEAWKQACRQAEEMGMVQPV